MRVGSKGIGAAVLASSALLGLGCGGAAAEREPARSPDGSVETGVIERAPSGGGSGLRGAGERGEASFYAKSLAGRPTASGEPYSPSEMTAAHRTLPFGTLVEVSRDDGRAVTVRINDRGPFKSGRVIDLSRRAAEELGMIKAGVIEVRVRVVREAPEKPKRKRKARP